MRHLYKSNIVIFLGLILLVFTAHKGKSTKQESVYLDVYMNIFEPSCALSACHDGSFEPNFSTAQSAYYTLVLHDLIKNSPEGSFNHRVVPGDTTNSLLYERITNCCFVDDLDKMPLLNESLSKEEVAKIGEWIMLGAPDWKGDFPYKK